jgi:transcriptional regulator with XRE-family HTH domain
MTTIGERIKKLRKDAGLSQVKFCAALEVTQSFLSGLEKGRYQPTVALLIRIANIYRPDANWLLTGRSPAHKTTRSGEMGLELDHISAAILQLLRQLPEEKKQKVLEYAQEQKLLSEYLRRK